MTLSVLCEWGETYFDAGVEEVRSCQMLCNPNYEDIDEEECLNKCPRKVLLLGPYSRTRYWWKGQKLNTYYLLCSLII